MIEELDQLSNHLFDLKTGTLYPLLHSLEEKGLVFSYESMENVKKRKYYSLTKQGKEFLTQKKQE